MRKQFIVWFAAIGMAACLLSYAVAQQKDAMPQQGDVTVELKNAQGESVGTATLTPIANNKGVRIKLDTQFTFIKWPSAKARHSKRPDRISIPLRKCMA
jgi:hypothetical protein